MNLSVGIFTPGLRAEPEAEPGGWENVELRPSAPLRPGAAGGPVWMRGQRDCAAQGSLMSPAGWLSTAVLCGGCAASYRLEDSFWHLLVPCDI